MRLEKLSCHLISTSFLDLSVGFLHCNSTAMGNVFFLFLRGQDCFLSKVGFFYYQCQIG